jgi:hypothetical protein
MLDLTQIARQMQGISQHLAKEAEAARQRVALASQLIQQAQARQAELIQQLQQYRPQLGFAAAEPVESLNLRIMLPTAPSAHTVLATDGSQISPSHHEIAYCYLLNLGRIVLHYGQGRYPLLDSLPEVVYRAEDLYLSRQWGISTEEWMGYRRTMAEAVVLAELAAAQQGARGQGGEAGERSAELTPLFAPSPPPSPTLAMTDGSLIYWFLEPLPAAAREQILPPILAAWEQLRRLGVPLVGYVSASRSTEGLNFLRLQSCPHDEPDCLRHCQGKTDGAPCHRFAPLRDVTLWATLLEPGQRSPLWKSSAEILSAYGEQAIYFCYVHVGAEVARLEFPQWVAADPTLLETALSLTLAQVQKGYGYPVALAEAHNQAVVRGGDRRRFFALLEQEMVRAGMANVGISYKEARKRGSIA